MHHDLLSKITKVVEKGKRNDFREALEPHSNYLFSFHLFLI
jgi:hypothetical protein